MFEGSSQPQFIPSTRYLTSTRIPEKKIPSLILDKEKRMREKRHDILVFQTLHITTQPQFPLVHPCETPSKRKKVSPPSRINNAFRSRHAKETERGAHSYSRRFETFPYVNGSWTRMGSRRTSNRRHGFLVCLAVLCRCEMSVLLFERLLCPRHPEHRTWQIQASCSRMPVVEWRVDRAKAENEPC